MANRNDLSVNNNVSMVTVKVPNEIVFFFDKRLNCFVCSADRNARAGDIPLTKMQNESLVHFIKASIETVNALFADSCVNTIQFMDSNDNLPNNH